MVLHKHTLTEAGNELSEVDERVRVLVEKAEEADGETIGVCAAGPGKEHQEQSFKLLQVHAVLLQVGQAWVVSVHRVTGATPVTAGQVFGLEGSAEEEKHHTKPADLKIGPAVVCYHYHSAVIC